MPVNASESKVKKEFKDFPTVPEGVYAVEIADVTKKKDVETKWGLKDYFYIYLGVLDQTDQRGARIFYKVSTAFTSGYEGGQQSKLYELACAVYKEQLDDSSDFDVNTLIGGRITVMVSSTKKDNKTYVNITGILKADARVISLPNLTDEEIANIAPKAAESDNLSDEELDNIAKEIE